jgi:hypothetical protein
MEIFYSLKELCVLAERWRVHFNTVSTNSSPGYNPAPPAAWLTQASQGMEKREAKNVFSFSMSPTTETSHILYAPRYANNPTGKKHRADKLSRRQEKCSTQIGREPKLYGAWSYLCCACSLLLFPGHRRRNSLPDMLLIPLGPLFQRL